MGPGSRVPAHLRPEVILMIHRKAIQPAGQFPVCFPDRFGTTEVSSGHPKFYFFYEIQREVFILRLPCWDRFMSSLSISQYTGAIIGLICPFASVHDCATETPTAWELQSQKKQQAFHQAVCAPLQVTAAGSRPCQPLFHAPEEDGGVEDRTESEKGEVR